VPLVQVLPVLPKSFSEPRLEKEQLLLELESPLLEQEWLDTNY
jgi:hypothetical protein